MTESSLKAKRAARKTKKDQAARNRRKQLALYQETGKFGYKRAAAKWGRTEARHEKAIRKLDRFLARFPDLAKMTTSTRGVEFIKSFEGFSPKPVNIGDGVLTWGYGHTDSDGSKPPKSISVKDATKLLAEDLKKTYEPVVRKLFVEGAPLHGKFTQHLFDALVSLAYNLGIGALLPYPHTGFETLGNALQRGSLKAIAAALPLYRSPGTQFEAGLLRRRNHEARLLLTGNYKID